MEADPKLAARWYSASDDMLRFLIPSHVERIKENQSWVYDNMKNLMDLYVGGSDRGKSRYIQTRVMQAAGEQLARMNIIASIADTLKNRATSQTNRVMALPSGGRWQNRVRAKSLEKYITGVFYAHDFYRIARQVVLDAGIQNIGYLITGFDGEDIFFERIPPHEIIVDEDQAYQGKVVEAFRVKDYPVHVAEEMWPDHDWSASQVQSESLTNESYQTEVVRVYEAWRLPVVRGKKGTHVIATADFLLEKEDYEEDDFPFVAFRWKERPGHWIGLGCAEEVYSLQKEIDRTIRRIQVNHELHGDPPMLRDKRSKVSESQTKLAYSGKVIDWDSQGGASPPALLVQPSIHPEFYTWVEQVAKWAYETYGVSQLSAQGMRPAGNDLSGFAFKVLQDIETKRFANLEQEWQEFPVKVAKKVINLSHKVYGDREKTVKFAARSFAETIDWSSAAMQDSEFFLRLAPASLFPDTVPGRLNTATQLMESKLFNREEILLELQAPEIERQMTLKVAPIEHIHMLADQILYKGRYFSPNKHQPLEAGIQIFNFYLLDAQQYEDAPQDRLAMLIDWMDEAEALLKQIKLEAMQEQAAFQQMAMVGPEPSGTSAEAAESAPPQQDIPGSPA